MARPKMDKERKVQIIDALERMVVRDGLAQLTLAKVAVEAELPRSLLRYFAGNKNDLILLLFDRMIERGENKLAQLIDAHEGALRVGQILDLILDELFGDADLGAMVDELWPYAAKDDRIQERLRGLYQRLCQEIAQRMAMEGLGDDDDDRYRRAYFVVAAGFGASSFAEINFLPNDTKAFRALTRDMLQLT